MRNSLVIGNFTEIERVQRLAKQIHNIVGYVNNVVNRTRACAYNALGKPIGARCNFDALNNARRIAFCTVGAGNFHVHLFRRWRKRAVFLNVKQRRKHVTLIHRAHFTRHTKHRQAVGTVRRNFQIKNRIRQTRILSKGNAHRRVIRQNHDTIFTFARRQAKLTARAIHAETPHAAFFRLLDSKITRQNSTTECRYHVIAFVEILRSAHHLQRLRISLFVGMICTNIDRCYKHMVRIRMRNFTEHLATNYLVELGSCLCNTLNARARYIKAVAKRLNIAGYVNIFREPFKRYFHSYSSS